MSSYNATEWVMLQKTMIYPLGSYGLLS